MSSSKCWYSPENRNEAPLQGPGTITVGYRPERPFEFLLETTQNKSSGFLKLFVSTEPLELEQIQLSKSPLKVSGEGRLTGGRVAPKRQESSWNAVAVCITVYRDN
jgi:hypothetical protein